MKDLHIGVLKEFAERQRLGFELVPALPPNPMSGAAYRAAGRCPDCGGTPAEQRMRCVPCATKHAAKCRAAYQIRKEAA